MLDKTKDLDPDFLPHEGEKIVSAAKKPSVLLRVSKGLLQIILMVAILAGSVFAMNQLIASKPAAKAKHAFKTVYTIKTTQVERMAHQPEFVSYGQIEAARKVDLRSLVSGEVVSVSKKLRAGARVSEGEALVEIDRFNYQGALREAQANLKETEARLLEYKARIVSEKSKLISAKDQLAIAERDLARAKSLNKNGTMTTQQVEVRTLVYSQRQQALNLSENMVKIEQARLGQQEAAAERLQWRVLQAEKNLQNTVLKAPFAGIVRSSAVDVGKLLSANDVVVSLYEPGKLEAKFTLTDAQFGRLQSNDEGLVGRKVKISWSTGGQQQNYTGSIERIGAEINSSRGGIEVFASLNNTGFQFNIRPGAFVEIVVPDKVFNDTVKLPEQSVYNGKHVYVVRDGKLNKREIAIAAYDGEYVLISSGLQTGEKVLSTRIAEVGEGLRVREEGADDSSKTSKPNDKLSGNKRGPPSIKELSAILIAKNLSKSKWKELDLTERRRIVREHRTVSGG